MVKGKKVSIMSDFRQIGAIALLLFLSACAPVEEPVSVTAPIAPIEKTPVKQDPVEQTDTAQASDETTDSADGADVAIAPSDNQTLAQSEAVILQDVAKQEQAEEIEAPKKEETPPPPPPPPLPDPFNPTILIGQPSTALADSLGDSDYSYDNSGMTISHYRAESCIVLVFSAPDDEIMHIDVRHPIVGTSLDEAACYQELGDKKDALN